MRRTTARPPRSALLAVAVVLAAGCGGDDGAAGDDARSDRTQAWCAQVARAAPILSDAQDEGRLDPPDAEVVEALRPIFEEVAFIGTPEGLREPGEVLGAGPPPPGDTEAQAAYDEALAEAEAFVRTQCDVDPEVAELLFTRP